MFFLIKKVRGIIKIISFATLHSQNHDFLNVYLSSSFLIVLNAYVSIHESARHCHTWFASWHKWYTVLHYTLLFFINSFWDFFISLYTDLVHFYLLMIVHQRIMLQLIYLSFYWWTLKWFSRFSFLCIFFLTSLTAQNEWKVFFFLFLAEIDQASREEFLLYLCSLPFSLSPDKYQVLVSRILIVFWVGSANSFQS